MRGDGVYKRPGSPYWYFKRKDSGRWREVSTKARNYNDAKRVRQKAFHDQEEGRLPEGEIARWPFERATTEYLRIAAVRLRPSSVKKESFFLVRPIESFGKLACEVISETHIQRLQADMKVNGCRNSYINLVVGASSRVLRFAKTWRRIQDNVTRLREPKCPIARILTSEQKTRLFQVAASEPRWSVAYAAALIAANTASRGADLRPFRWSDVDFLAREISIPSSKTDAGVRRVPLNEDAFLGFRIMYQRAVHLNIANPISFVFPACEHGHIDATQSQRSWRSAWRSLTKVAGLQGLRFHDLKHQCVTELAENGTPELTILAIAGHVSRRMLEHYSHIRMEAKRKAVHSLPSIVSRGYEESAHPIPN
jgi:integrase